MDERPLCVDLFCGLGGWAEGFLREGYRVVGFDNDPQFAKVYPGEFVLADVRTLDGRRFRDARCIVASPPCNEFTRLRFLRNAPPPPDTSCVEAVRRIREESGVPTVMENVEGARAFIGPAVAHRGPWYLWGDVPLLFSYRLPPKEGRVGRKTWGRNGEPALRARIPLPLARAVARGFL